MLDPVHLPERMPSTEASLIQQQHVLEEYAEQMGRKERLSFIFGLIGIGLVITFLIVDTVRGRFTFRGVTDLIMLFFISAGSCWQSRRFRRNRLGLEEDARQLRSNSSAQANPQNP